MKILLLCPLFQIFSLERYGIGFSFSNIMEESYFLLSTYIMLTFDSVLYMLLAIYFDKVLQGKCGLYLQLCFPPFYICIIRTVCDSSSQKWWGSKRILNWKRKVYTSEGLFYPWHILVIPRSKTMKYLVFCFPFYLYLHCHWTVHEKKGLLYEGCYF